MKPSTPKTELPPSTPLRKAVFGGSQQGSQPAANCSPATRLFEALECATNRWVAVCRPLKPPRATRSLARLALLMVAALCLAGSGAQAQNLVADFRLQSSLTSDIGAPPPLEFLGASSFTNETVDGINRTVVAFPAGDGLTLTNASVVLSNNRYSVVVLFRFATINRWNRILDFKNRTSDWGLYAYYNNLNFYNITTGSGGSMQAGTYLQVVLTRDAAGLVAGYVNASPEISFSDAGGEALLSADNALNFFRDDFVVQNEHSAGAAARVRIYDDALSPAQVAALDRLPDIVGVLKPEITSSTTTYAAAGVPFSFQVIALNNPDNFSASSLPAWAILNNLTGLITGTPPAVGANVVQISANNAAGSDTKPLTIIIEPFTLAAGRAGGATTLTLSGPTGRQYVVDYANALSASNAWQTLSNFTLSSSPFTLFDPGSSNAVMRFYRAGIMKGSVLNGP